MMETPYLQAAVVSVVIGIVVYLLLLRRRHNFPPGPWRLPVLGNLLQLGHDTRYHIKIFEWSRKYGPVVTVGLGPLELVVVNTVETALEVLVKKSTDFAGRRESPSTECFSNGYKDIALAKYGPMWKLKRKISVKALRHYMQGDALEKRIRASMESTLRVLETKEEPFDPEDILNYLFVNIILGLCFNREYEYGNTEMKYIQDLKDELYHIFLDFMPEEFFPPLRYVYKSRPMKRMKEAIDAVIAFISKQYFEQKKTFDKDNIRHLTDMLILARQEAIEEDGNTVGDLTDEHLISTIFDIIFAGVDTSRHTLSFAILNMIAFPDIQQKVQQEIDRGVGKNRLPGVEDRPNLCYAEAVLHESMRLGTVAPSGVFHSAMKDTTIAGYNIPKDTLVMINHWALHNDPDVWDEVDKFKPERFLDENGQLGPKPASWLPFSAGKRVCMGEFVAKPTLHLLFAGLIQRYSWRAESGVKVKTTPEGYMNIGLVPKYKVVIEKRT